MLGPLVRTGLGMRISPNTYVPTAPPASTMAATTNAIEMSCDAARRLAPTHPRARRETMARMAVLTLRTPAPDASASDTVRVDFSRRYGRAARFVVQPRMDVHFSSGGRSHRGVGSARFASVSHHARVCDNVRLLFQYVRRRPPVRERIVSRPLQRRRHPASPRSPYGFPVRHRRGLLRYDRRLLERLAPRRFRPPYVERNPLPVHLPRRRLAVRSDDSDGPKLQRQ